MKAIAAVLLIALPASAQDAGVLLLPDGTVCLDPSARKAAADRIVFLETANAEKDKALKSPVPVIITVVVGVVAAGVAFAVGRATAPPTK